MSVQALSLRKLAPQPDAVPQFSGPVPRVSSVLMTRNLFVSIPLLYPGERYGFSPFRSHRSEVKSMASCGVISLGDRRLHPTEARIYTEIRPSISIPSHISQNPECEMAIYNL